MKGKLIGVRQKFRTSIKLQIVGYALFSLLIAQACFLVFGTLFRVISSQTIEPANAERALAQGIAAFQEYVSDNELSSLDISATYGWTDGSVIALPGSGSGHGYQNRDQGKHLQLETDESGGRVFQTTAGIAYTDGTENTRFVYVTDEEKLEVFIHCIGLLAFAVFFIHFYWQLKRKLNYISEIEDGVNILESGDLSYQLAVIGEDELGRLAISINEMGLSLSERIEAEQQALRSGREIIGDLSHDIRTPLTILSGYIPLLLEGEPLTDTQREYLALMNKKTEQMRKRVDELLDYATIYSGQRKVEKVPMQARSLAEQFSSELATFSPNITNQIGAGTYVSADPALLERVFDNLISNLYKYADPEQAVRLTCREDGASIVLELENSIRADAASEGKTMGNKIVEYIMRLHDGTMDIRQQDGQYRVILTFQISSA